MNRNLLRAGFCLMLLALIGALFIPAMALPRLGLSAHTVGVLGGVWLIAVGAVWPAFDLGPRLAVSLSVGSMAAGYLNWLGCVLGAVLGAGRATPIAAAGATGSARAEMLVSGMLLAAAAASLLAVGLAIYGLRGKNATPS